MNKVSLLPTLKVSTIFYFRILYLSIVLWCKKKVSANFPQGLCVFLKMITLPRLWLMRAWSKLPIFLKWTPPYHTVVPHQPLPFSRHNMYCTLYSMLPILYPAFTRTTGWRQNWTRTIYSRKMLNKIHKNVWKDISLVCIDRKLEFFIGFQGIEFWRKVESG